MGAPSREDERTELPDATVARAELPPGFRGWPVQAGGIRSSLAWNASLGGQQILQAPNVVAARILAERKLSVVGPAERPDHRGSSSLVRDEGSRN
jgi:hypothetical protein